MSTMANTRDWLATNGRFRILRPLGEGGFGRVFLAEQSEPVRRRVALKVVKQGMHSPGVLARFAAELQMLAHLHHPHIASVLDAGELENGLPYFAMEWVDGRPITEYCAERQLSIQARLELVCCLGQAIQHAHQKGIIHRDLKPSNVLVTETDDGQPLLKVIDFGIAKALAGESGQALEADENEVTELTAQHFGTPQYMSPEQARGDLDIDTRADVYSLGVILYELITGTTPITLEEVETTAFVDLLKHIRLTEPPKPSLRLTQIGAAAATTTVASDQSERVRTRTRTLTKSVRGEMDWIVMKALEKDRGRRYDSVRSLVADLERFGRGEPVSAGPPTNFYRTRKFVARHRLAVSAIALVFITLIAGTLVSLTANRHAQDALERAREGRLELAAERERRLEILGETEAIALGVASDLLPGLEERGRSNLMGPVVDWIRSYADEQWTPDRHADQLARIGKAQVYLLQSRGKSEEALHLLEGLFDLTEEEEERHELTWLRGTLLESLGRENEALASFQRLVSSSAIEDMSLWQWQSLARAMVLSEEASELYAEAAEALPQYLGRGSVREMEAEASFRAAEATRLWRGGDRFASEAMFKKIIARLRQVTQQDSARVSIKVLLAEIMATKAALLDGFARRAEMGRYEFLASAADLEDATVLYSELLEMNPDQAVWEGRYVELLHRLGNAWSQVDQASKAHAAYEKALSHGGKSPDSFESLSVVRDQVTLYLKQWNGQAAKKGLAQLSVAAGRPGDAWTALRTDARRLEGEFELYWGDPEKAMEILVEVCQEIEGESQGILYGLVASTAEELQRDEASKEWRSRAVDVWRYLCEEDPANGYRQRELVKAEALLKRALEPQSNEVEDFVARKPDPSPEEKRLRAAWTASRDGDRATRFGKYTEADVLLTTAEQELGRLLEESDTVADAVLDLRAYQATRRARWHRLQGTPRDGLAWNERAFEYRTALWERTGEDVYRERRTVDILEHGMSYVALRDFAAAENRMLLALREERALLENQAGPKSSLLLDHMGNTTYQLAAVRARRGDLEGAEDFFLRSMAIRRDLVSGHLHTFGAKNKVLWTGALNQSRDGVAQIYWRQGRLVEAAHAWESLIPSQKSLVSWRETKPLATRPPVDYVRLINAYHRLGRLEVSRGRWDAARDVLAKGGAWAETIRERWPDHDEHHEILAEGLHWQAVARTGAGETERALTLFLEAEEVADRPGLEDLLLEIRLSHARAQWEAGRTVEAESLLERVLDRGKPMDEPGRTCAEGWALQGEIACARGDWERGRGLIDRAEHSLAERHAERPRYDEAIALARVRALAVRLRDPSGPWSPPMGKLDLCAAFWKRQLEADASHEMARQSLGTVLELGFALLEEALKLHPASIALSQRYAEQCRALALHERDWGRLSRALQLCERGLEALRERGDATSFVELRATRDQLLARSMKVQKM